MCRYDDNFAVSPLVNKYENQAMRTARIISLHWVMAIDIYVYVGLDTRKLETAIKGLSFANIFPLMSGMQVVNVPENLEWKSR